MSEHDARFPQGSERTQDVVERANDLHRQHRAMIAPGGFWDGDLHRKYVLALQTAWPFASATIASLREEVERLTGDVSHIEECNKAVQSELAAAESRVSVLEGALKPFDEVLDDIEDNVADDCNLWESPAAMNLTVGDLRTARKARRSLPDSEYRAEYRKAVDDVTRMNDKGEIPPVNAGSTSSEIAAHHGVAEGLARTNATQPVSPSKLSPRHRAGGGSGGTSSRRPAFDGA